MYDIKMRIGKIVHTFNNGVNVLKTQDGIVIGGAKTHPKREDRIYIKTIKFIGYRSGAFECVDNNDRSYLFVDGIELTKDVFALECYSYLNGDWHYKDIKNIVHLFRDGRELTKNVNAEKCFSYSNGDWEYVEQSELHKYNSENIKFINF